MSREKRKLVVIALDKQNAGKATNWYGILGRKTRTGLKKLNIGESEIKTSIRNSSFD